MLNKCKHLQFDKTIALNHKRRIGVGFKMQTCPKETVETNTPSAAEGTHELTDRPRKHMHRTKLKSRHGQGWPSPALAKPKYKHCEQMGSYHSNSNTKSLK